MALNDDYKQVLSYWDFLESAQNGTISFYVDKGLAINLANSGYDTGKLSGLLMALGVLMFIMSIPMAVWLSFISAFICICSAVLLMKLAPYFLINKIKQDVLTDPDTYRFLRDKNVIIIQSTKEEGSK